MYYDASEGDVGREFETPDLDILSGYIWVLLTPTVGAAGKMVSFFKARQKWTDLQKTFQVFLFISLWHQYRDTYAFCPSLHTSLPKASQTGTKVSQYRTADVSEQHLDISKAESHWQKTQKNQSQTHSGQIVSRT